MGLRLNVADYVYRVIDPSHRDEYGPLAIAFEDPGKNYESVSLFVASVASPSDALASLAPYLRAKQICKTGKSAPSPKTMFDNGYRVSRIPANFILEAIEKTRTQKRPLKVELVDGDDYDRRGHLNLFNGKYHSQMLADAELSGIVELSRSETLGTD